LTSQNNSFRIDEISSRRLFSISVYTDELLPKWF